MEDLTAMLPPLGKQDQEDLLSCWPGLTDGLFSAAPFSFLDELLLDDDAAATDDQLAVVPDLLELDLASVQAGLQQHCDSLQPHSPAAAWVQDVRPPAQPQPGGLMWVPAAAAATDWQLVPQASPPGRAAASAGASSWAAPSSIGGGGDTSSSSSSVSGVPSVSPSAASSHDGSAHTAQSGSVLGAAFPRRVAGPAAASSPQPACAPHQLTVGPVPAPATPAAVVAAPVAAAAVVSAVAQPPAAAAVTRAVLNATRAAAAPAAAATTGRRPARASAAARSRPPAAARVAPARVADAGRAAAVARYRAKRQRRLARVAAGMTKVVKYQRRKEVADSRPRVGGRFVKVVRGGGGDAAAAQ